MYPEGEREFCAECEDVRLIPVHDMPQSFEEAEAEAARWEATLPQDRTLPLGYVGRGRGALVALSIAGLAAFFAPWLHMHVPEEASFSGFDLARSRLPWLWGGAAGWFTLLPLVSSRRTVTAMRGVRIIAATFCSMTLLEAILLLAVPPARGAVPHSYDWAWGLYASAALSFVAVFVATRFGGSLSRFDPNFARRNGGATHRETSDGETLN